jgi:hypothetical protein
VHQFLIRLLFSMGEYKISKRQGQEEKGKGTKSVFNKDGASEVWTLPIEGDKEKRGCATPKIGRTTPFTS